MSSEYNCSYCGEDLGGFHACRRQARHAIERYLSEAKVVDVDELTDVIGALGYWGKS